MKVASTKNRLQFLLDWAVLWVRPHVLVMLHTNIQIFYMLFPLHPVEGILYGWRNLTKLFPNCIPNLVVMYAIFKLKLKSKFTPNKN